MYKHLSYKKMNSKGKHLLDIVIKEYFNDNFELPEDSKITLTRLINYCYTEAEQDIYMFWLTLGQELARKIDFYFLDNCSISTILKSLFYHILNDLPFNDRTPNDFAVLFKTQEIYSNFEYESEFDIYHKYSNGEEIISALYRDSVTARMNGKQLNRIAHWIPLCERIRICKIEKGKYFIKESSKEDDQFWNDVKNSVVFWMLSYRHICKNMPRDIAIMIGKIIKESNVVKLKSFLKNTLISNWYVTDGSDENTWISMEEIGNNDDYQA
jgi:hypothetical protein